MGPSIIGAYQEGPHAPASQHPPVTYSARTPSRSIPCAPAFAAPVFPIKHPNRHNTPLKHPNRSIHTRSPFHPPPHPQQVYREKLKAEVEGRAFTPPPPSSVPPPSTTSTSRSNMGSRPGSANGRPSGRAGGDDGWGDWGNGAEGNGVGNGFSSNSEYTRSQYVESASRKEEFFASKMQVGRLLGCV